MTERREQDAETPVCDFCCDMPAQWVNPAETFVLALPETAIEPVVNQASLGGWAACDQCQALIVTGNREALIDAAMGTMPVHVVGLFGADKLRQSLAELHAEFFRCRVTGQIHRYEGRAA